MLLAVDIGNSEITLGIFQGETWKYIWRVSSAPDRPELFYGIKIRDYLLESDVQVSDVKQMVLSSVVPALTDKVSNVLMTLFHRDPIVLGPELYQRLPLRVLNPFEIGSDLVANALAAYMRYKRNCVVVDFGTALTFTTISSDGEILGVAIVPGLKTAIRSLSQNTAKLFDVPLELPDSVLGKNTVHAIQAGILRGYEGLVRSMLDQIRSELNDPGIPVVATGGLSSIIKSLHDVFDAIDPNLTLDGLKITGTIFGK